MYHSCQKIKFWKFIFDIADPNYSYSYSYNEISSKQAFFYYHSPFNSCIVYTVPCTYVATIISTILNYCNS